MATTSMTPIPPGGSSTGVATGEAGFFFEPHLTNFIVNEIDNVETASRIVDTFANWLLAQGLTYEQINSLYNPQG